MARPITGGYEFRKGRDKPAAKPKSSSSYWDDPENAKRLHSGNPNLTPRQRERALNIEAQRQMRFYRAGFTQQEIENSGLVYWRTGRTKVESMIRRRQRALVRYMGQGLTFDQASERAARELEAEMARIYANDPVLSRNRQQYQIILRYLYPEDGE